MTNSHQKQASRDAHTMFGVCWLHLLFCMFVVLSAAVVPRSLVVVVVGVGEPARGDWIEASVYSRGALRPGAAVAGPAILVEDETTTLVTNGFSASVNGLGQIVLTKDGAVA